MLSFSKFNTYIQGSQETERIREQQKPILILKRCCLLKPVQGLVSWFCGFMDHGLTQAYKMLVCAQSFILLHPGRQSIVSSYKSRRCYEMLVSAARRGLDGPYARAALASRSNSRLLIIYFWLSLVLTHHTEVKMSARLVNGQQRSEREKKFPHMFDGQQSTWKRFSTRTLYFKLL